VENHALDRFIVAKKQVAKNVRVQGAVRERSVAWMGVGRLVEPVR